MKTPKMWHGVRMRKIALGADPDQPARALTLPAIWDDAAAAALAELAPGTGPASLAQVAEAWIRPIGDRARRAGIFGATSYWSPGVHDAAFELPPYIASGLPR